MNMLHDDAFRASIDTRLNSLRQDSRAQWGKMSPDQMLWHVNQFLAGALGEGSMAPTKMPLPLPIMRFMLLYLPWPKSAPTNPSALARDHYDFEAERTRCRELISRFARKPLTEPWPVDPNWGAAGGAFASKLQARHLDHHLRQFGA